MERIIKAVSTIAAVGIILMCVCLLDSVQAKAAEIEGQTVIDIDTVIDYVANDDSLQIYFNDGTGYYWEKEVNASSEFIADECMLYDNDIFLDNIVLPDSNFVDMNMIVDFVTTEYGLQIYFIDGSGYWWELE